MEEDQLALLRNSHIVHDGVSKPIHSKLTRGDSGKQNSLYLLFVFCVTTSLLYADQNLMAPNLTAIAKSFGFDNEQRDKYLGGYIAAGFYMIGAPSALLFGYLCDRMNRRNLLVVCILLGEGPCILTFFVTKFWQLFILRLLTGISLGGAFPLVFSLLSDIYGPKHRAVVSSFVQISTGVGLAAGQGVSGIVGPVLGWRWPFVLVAVPAIVLAVLMMFLTKEPIRGYNELDHTDNNVSHPQQYSEHINWSKLKVLLRTPTNVLCILQGLPGCLPWGILLTFLNDFLAQEKGISVAKATSIVLMVGIGGACGVIAGGLLGQYLYNKAKWRMSVFIGTCTVFASFPLWFLVNASVKSSIQRAYLAAFGAGALSSTVGPNIRAMIMNVNEPETRGVALALQSTLDDLGKGLGPALVAALISRLGRSQAFNISAAGWIPCGLLLLLTGFTLSHDEQLMRYRIMAPTVVSGEMEMSERGPH